MARRPEALNPRPSAGYPAMKCESDQHRAAGCESKGRFLSACFLPVITAWPHPLPTTSAQSALTGPVKAPPLEGTPLSATSLLRSTPTPPSLLNNLLRRLSDYPTASALYSAVNTLRVLFSMNISSTAAQCCSGCPRNRGSRCVTSQSLFYVWSCGL